MQGSWVFFTLHFWEDTHILIAFDRVKTLINLSPLVLCVVCMRECGRKEGKKSCWCNLCVCPCFNLFSVTLSMLSLCFALGFQGQEKPLYSDSMRLIFQWWLNSSDRGTLLPLHWTWVWLCVNMHMDVCVQYKCMCICVQWKQSTLQPSSRV